VATAIIIYWRDMEEINDFFKIQAHSWQQTFSFLPIGGYRKMMKSDPFGDYTWRILTTSAPYFIIAVATTEEEIKNDYTFLKTHLLAQLKKLPIEIETLTHHMQYCLDQKYKITNGVTTTTTSSETVTGETATGECAVCFDNKPDVVIIPCGHIALCENCAKKVQERSNLCPICNCTIERCIKVYTI